MQLQLIVFRDLTPIGAPLDPYWGTAEAVPYDYRQRALRMRMRPVPLTIHTTPHTIAWVVRP